MDFKFHVGWCPFCNQGWINKVKEVSRNEILLFCDECDTIWESPNDVISDKPVILENFISSVQEPELSEIKKIGWDKFLIKITETK